MSEADLSAEIIELRKQLQEAQNIIACLTASRDRWKAEAKGKITPEWKAIYEAGAKPIEGWHPARSTQSVTSGNF